MVAHAGERPPPRPGPPPHIPHIDSSWRWGFGVQRPTDQLRDYERFWQNAMNWLIGDPANDFRLWPLCQPDNFFKNVRVFVENGLKISVNTVIKDAPPIRHPLIIRA